MNKIYPKKVDFTKVLSEEKAFLKNLKKIKVQNINVCDMEDFSIGKVKFVTVRKSKLEDFSGANIGVEEIDLSAVEKVLSEKRTIKNILAEEITLPIYELIPEQIQNTFDSIISFVSFSKN